MRKYIIQENSTRERIDSSLFSQKTVITPSANIEISYSADPADDEIVVLAYGNYLSLANPENTPLYVRGLENDEISIFNNVVQINPFISY